MAPIKALFLLPLALAVREKANLKVDMESEMEEEAGGVVITQGSFDPLVLTDAFLNVWSAIPLTSSADFRISGDLVHMVKVLAARPHLPVECESMWIGQPVSLVVNHAADKAADLYAKAFVGGFVNVGGMVSLATKLVTGAIASLTANPSAVTLDNAIDAILRSGTVNKIAGNRRWTPKSIWYWLTGKKTIATLTLKHKPEKKYGAPMAKFQCVKNEHPGEYGTRDRPAYVAILGKDGEMIPLNSHRLQLIIMALA
eukprot:CAMPEP_0114641734 /NCGR_PEP_ID=MMETSP0191-20121206/2431_1 /TAXON_ID=126664 /ORGANISM="Sorites sp." /LENGTH=255 /DNA_ID=CAMNT_0001853827 /DNA_START=49 /DNA_END=816 /DNA_ORIENTATION=+